MDKKENRVSRVTFFLVLLLIISFTLLIKCLNIDIDNIFLILFIFMTTLTLLFNVNSFISNVIDKIKINQPTTNNEVDEDTNNSTDMNQTDNDKNAETIGFIERILYFIGITTQNWTLISIVIVIKTIARYKEIDKQIKAEYFLIGSLLSLLSAIIISVIFISFDKIHSLGITNYILSLVSYNLKIIN